MSKHKPYRYSTEIEHVSECALERAIVLGKYSFLGDTRVYWLDIELPVEQSGNARDKCIDLIGKDIYGHYVICELKFRRNYRDNGNPMEAAEQVKSYYDSIKANHNSLRQHENANGIIEWSKVVEGSTRLIVAANEAYWDSWYGKRRKKGEYVPSGVECYSIDVNQDWFEEQKSSSTKDKYTPSLPDTARKWIKK